MNQTGLCVICNMVPVSTGHNLCTDCLMKENARANLINEIRKIPPSITYAVSKLIECNRKLVAIKFLRWWSSETTNGDIGLVVAKNMIDFLNDNPLFISDRK